MDEPPHARKRVGREVTLRVERPIVTPGKPVLEVKNLTLADAEGRLLLDGGGFQAREGGGVGLARVAGNGQTAPVDALMGLRKADAGEIHLDGKVLKSITPQSFTDAGGAIVPEDRHHEGVALELSVLDNL